MNVSVRDVTKRFGTTLAVDRLSLEIGRGELVSLVGGSGCGKTTTLRMIVGFERPDAGAIVLDGRVVNDVAPRERGVGIVFQSYALFPTMTVGEDIAFGLRVARWREPAIRDRVAEAVMAEGRIEQVGRPEEVYDRPRTRFVADFIGTANLFSCLVLSVADGRLDCDGVTLRVPGEGLRDGERVVVSVRPEKLVVGDAPGPRPDGWNRLEGVVEGATFLGALVRLEVSVAGRTLVVDVPHTSVPDRDRRLTLGFAAGDCAVVRAGADGARPENR